MQSLRKSEKYLEKGNKYLENDNNYPEKGEKFMKKWEIMRKDWLHFISSTPAKQLNGKKGQLYRKMKNGGIYIISKIAL